MAMTNNLKFDRRNTNAAEARAFADEITSDNTLVYHISGQNTGLVMFEQITVYKGRYPVTPSDIFCREGSNWVSGIAHSETKNGELILNRIPRELRNRVCGNLARMRDNNLAGYSTGLSAKVVATVLDDDGQTTKATFYVNRVEQIVPTGPVQAEDDQDADQG